MKDLIHIKKTINQQEEIDKTYQLYRGLEVDNCLEREIKPIFSPFKANRAGQRKLRTEACHNPLAKDTRANRIIPLRMEFMAYDV